LQATWVLGDTRPESVPGICTDLLLAGYDSPWSTRSLGRRLGVQHTIVARAWREAGLQPHRLERYMRSTDPDFETKAADVIGLYLDPPQYGVVFCVDEKTAIQALDRIDPILPLPRPRGTAWVRVLPARHIVPLCGAQYPHG